MLEKLDKIAPYLALALLGYLAYSATETRTPRIAQGKEPPVITREMLRPRLIEPVKRASPAGRDPFEVAWASYLENMEPDLPSSRSSAGRPAPSTAPTPLSASGPAQTPSPPPLPAGRLAGVIVGGDVQFVIIEGTIYKPGDAIENGGSGGNWVVERIMSEGVVLRFGDMRHTLLITPTAAGATKGGGK